MKRKAVITLVCVNIFTLILNIIARNNVNFANYYSTHIYNILVNVFAPISSLFAYSIAESIIIGLVLSIIICIFLAVFKKLRISISNILMLIFGTATAVFLIFTLTCGINYHRRPFSQYSNLEIKKHSNDDLIKLCEILIEDANQYCNATYDKDNVEKDAKVAMKELATDYPALKGYYPNAKPLVFSEFMSYQFICGFYFPFTIESNYNSHMPAINIPATICHELSHLRGFMREDEAEFIAYLACMNSEDDYFKYSGTILALSYALNSVYDNCGNETYTQLYSKMDPKVIEVFNNEYEYWQPYKGPVAEVSDAVNNSYLVMNNQTDGVKSYGRMLDLLLAYYID